jgi:hypothetical protein
MLRLRRAQPGYSTAAGLLFVSFEDGIMPHIRLHTDYVPAAE